MIVLCLLVLIFLIFNIYVKHRKKKLYYLQNSISFVIIIVSYLALIRLLFVELYSFS